MPVTSPNPSTRALPASDVFTRFLKLAEEDLYKPDCTITVQTGFPNLNWGAIRFDHANAQGREPIDIAKIFAERPYIGITSCSIQRANQNFDQITYECSDGLVATLRVNNSSDQANALRAFDLAAKHFDLSPVSQIVVNNDGPWHDAVLKSREATISELTAVQQKLIAATAEFTTQDAERRRVAEVELEKRYREREAELVKQYDEKRAELDKRGAALAEKEEDYLSRNAQLARREEQRRLEKLLTDLKDETVSDSVSAKRWWTFASILALFVVAGGLAFFTGWHLFSADAFEWRFAVPFASSTFVVWATLTYFIQWNDRWAREHADAEFLSRRYRVDALRAQWLAEWVSEAAEGGKNLALPPELIAAFSRNMFETHVGGEALRHALERIIDQPKRLEVGKTLVQTGAEK